MSNFIDLHNHILPALDDGPVNMDQAVMLARDLVEAGYQTVVATPHTFEGEPAPELILERLNELQAELKRQNLPLKLLPGAEQMIEPDLAGRLAAGEVLTLNQTRYLLLELPMLQPLPVYTEQLLFTLAAEGYRPVIPHPERIFALQRNNRLLFRLHQAGAIFQVTWVAFTEVSALPPGKLPALCWMPIWCTSFPQMPTALAPRFFLLQKLQTI